MNAASTNMNLKHGQRGAFWFWKINSLWKRQQRQQKEFASLQAKLRQTKPFALARHDMDDTHAIENTRKTIYLFKQKNKLSHCKHWPPTRFSLDEHGK